jgi:predicted Zn finger-like uncharacterized protein
MHVECSACHARYVIADERIPIQGARVRCRKCQAVFSVERTGPSATTPTPSALPLIPPTPQEAGPASPAAAPASPAPSASPSPAPSAPAAHAPSVAAPAEASSFTSTASPMPADVDTQDVGPTQVERFATAFATTPETAVETQGLAPAAAPAPPPAPSASMNPFSRSAGIPEGLPEAERLKHERARRLARVLASDIAIYNKEKRERGIKEGNLVAVLGYEIKKSWEVYKERVTAEMANSTPYFRDALNEMLSEGKKVF